MASVSIEKVSKRYAATRVLHEVSLEISEGEFVILVGPSGCGKSTLLRMIAGLEDISGGHIRINDKVVNDVAPKERDIAMVFQSYALYPHMTVAENMAFSLKLAKIPKAEIAARVEKASSVLGLDPLLGRYPRQLSGGQRQRVAMGRAIVRDPSVFLFDEPLSNLDAKLRVAMRTEIKALHQRLKTTTIYVTHDQIEAMTMADKIVVMRDGHIEQVGRPLDLYDHPANLFVAQFIGSPSMNVLNGEIAGGVFKTEDGRDLPMPPHRLTSGQRAIYGVRPEHLAIARADAPDAFPVVVDVIEPTGAETQIFARFGNTPVVAVVRDRITANPGDELFLRPELEKIHLFSSDGKSRFEAGSDQ